MKKIHLKWALVEKQTGEILDNLYSSRSIARGAKAHMIDGDEFTIKRVSLKIIEKK